MNSKNDVDEIETVADELIKLMFKLDQKKNRRYEVFKQFFKETRYVIDQIIEEQMNLHEEEMSYHAALLGDRAARLKARGQELSEEISLLSDRKSALIEREDELRERETALAEREKQIAPEWEKMQVIKANLAALLNGREGT